jgi:hypothetical protein
MNGGTCLEVISVCLRNHFHKALTPIQPKVKQGESAIGRVVVSSSLDIGQEIRESVYLREFRRIDGVTQLEFLVDPSVDIIRHARRPTESIASKSLVSKRNPCDR